MGNLDQHIYDALKQIIGEAQENAPSIDELRAFKDQHDTFRSHFLHGKQYSDTVGKVFEQEPGMIEFNNQLELMTALGMLGFTPREIDSVVNYENDHIAKINALGANGRYQIQLCRLPDGTLHMYPSVKVYVSESATEEEKRRILQKITIASEQ
jgi:hypothetical protein